MKDQYKQLINEYREWLSGFNGQLLDQWNDLLKANVEAALCEAETRKLLSSHGCDVEPFEDPSIGGVDFKCTKDGNVFYVETTCITKEVATERSGLTDLTQFGKATYYAPLTRTFWQELSNKTSQCSGLDAPCLVVIGTFHFQAGCRCFGKRLVKDLLTGTPSISVTIDTKLGKAIDEPTQITELESSAFIRPSKGSENFFEYARCPISAVLLCPFGSDPVTVVGALHPNPNNPFSRDLLPEIEFSRLVKGYENGHLEVEWI